ncbi:MBOAT family O-acyltransferase [Helicobacter cetorum]|uniref:MBOAT family O-acyltransferase n=1 Tax=Helicobacter cetorum TaxID=138563 RepID=UPI003AF11535
MDYVLFVSFFPQLIAGPIVHHKEMMPQFIKKSNQFLNYRNIAIGLFIFSIGLFKKVVIADNISHFADFGFDKATSLSFIQAWMTSLSYTFQLYFDFSGYCDMAIGIALLFNIKLPINFNSPYKALNIQDFWRRWHITLSRFLKEYLYIPLGGNRVKEIFIYRNLIVVFLIGGFWHGAGWTFIIWGLLHGFALSVHRIYSSVAKRFQFTMPKILAWFITFNFINMAWVFFRAKDLGSALKVLRGMCDIKSLFKAPFIPTIKTDLMSLDIHNPFYLKTLLIILLITCIVTFFTKSSAMLYQQNTINMQKTLLTCLLLGIGLTCMFFNTETKFLYFNF